MHPHIWVAAPSELVAVSDLLAEFRDWWDKSEPSDESLRATVAVLLDDPDTEFLLGAGAEGKAMAVAQLRYRMSVWTSVEDCWLEDLYVREAGRRHGLGRALVSAVIERARARGCRRLELDVQEDNDGALALYRSIGLSSRPKGAVKTLLLAMRLDA